MAIKLSVRILLLNFIGKEFNIVTKFTPFNIGKYSPWLILAVVSLSGIPKHVSIKIQCNFLVCIIIFLHGQKKEF